MRKEIVALILEKEGKILVEKRKMTNLTVPGTVIFPAGHVKLGETREQALIREMKEELGIEIHGLKLVCQKDFDCEEQQRIFWYSCEEYGGELQNNEAEELLWINPKIDADLLTHQISKDALNSYFKLK
jgi:mutator protein MutT